jgi:tetratricopeptide (TPR) repeat protein
VNKQQWIVAGSGLLLLFCLFVFGRTTPPAKGEQVAATANNEAEHTHLETETVLNKAKSALTKEQAARISALENSITRGDLVTQKILQYGQLARYWKDSVGAAEPYLWYMGEKAKLEKSEKNLNFAAHSYLEELRGVSDPSVKTWMAIQAKGLYTESLALNPANDSAKVGYGSTFFFGAGEGGAPMEGIMKIREVAERDPENMFAQFMLGYGSLVSGQLDKAAERFLKVAQKTPENNEAIFLLAETYERLGEKENAIKWYKQGMSKVKNPQLIQAVEEKIKSLQ